MEGKIISGRTIPSWGVFHQNRNKLTPDQNYFAFTDPDKSALLNLPFPEA
jgi:hypothetical protein